MSRILGETLRRKWTVLRRRFIMLWLSPEWNLSGFNCSFFARSCCVAMMSAAGSTRSVFPYVRNVARREEDRCCLVGLSRNSSICRGFSSFRSVMRWVGDNFWGSVGD
jgi:hypothetical protein